VYSLVMRTHIEKFNTSLKYYVKWTPSYLDYGIFSTSQGNSVSVPIRLQAGRPGLNSWQGQ
jgi:hypothetical protein